MTAKNRLQPTRIIIGTDVYLYLLKKWSSVLLSKTEKTEQIASKRKELWPKKKIGKGMLNDL